MPRGSRAAALVAGAGLVAAWLAAAADHQPSPAVTAARDSTALARAEQLAQEIESQATRLRARLAAAPQPSASDRNPFSFQAPSPRATRGSQLPQVSLDAPAVLPTESLAEPEPLTLSGIAEDTATDGKAAVLVRTAVLSGFGDVFLAKAGDTIAGRYEVVLVGADAVEIKDLANGRTIRLGLR